MEVGNAFRKLGIPRGAVYTSKFDRAVETGKLVSGGDVTATLDITEGGLMPSARTGIRRTYLMITAKGRRALAATKDKGKELFGELFEEA